MNNNAVAVLLADLRDSRLMRLHGDAYMPRITAAIAALQTPAASSAPTNPSEIGSKSVDASSAGAGDAVAWLITWNDGHKSVSFDKCHPDDGTCTPLASPIAGGQASDVSSAQVNECQCAPYDELGIHDFRCPILGGQASEGASRRCKECCGSPCECPSGLAEAHTLRAEIARRIETFRYAGPLINAEEDAKAAALTKEWESLLAWADAQGERS